VTVDDARGGAYAELVVGLIDARERGAEERFDTELSAAEAAGRIDPLTARTLRWWQRESVRAVVAHAEHVLPSTLHALESSAAELRERTQAQRTPTVQPQPATVAMELDEDFFDEGAADDDLVDDEPTDTDTEQPQHQVLLAPLAAASGDIPPPPTDLTARRLLVAGLTPLRDP
jgi:hypothetical protein